MGLATFPLLLWAWYSDTGEITVRDLLILIGMSFAFGGLLLPLGVMWFAITWMWSKIEDPVNKFLNTKLMKKDIV